VNVSARIRLTPFTDFVTTNSIRLHEMSHDVHRIMISQGYSMRATDQVLESATYRDVRPYCQRPLNEKKRFRRPIFDGLRAGALEIRCKPPKTGENMSSPMAATGTGVPWLSGVSNSCEVRVDRLIAEWERLCTRRFLTMFMGLVVAIVSRRPRLTSSARSGCEM
jgi:hypothetical protein